MASLFPDFRPALDWGEMSCGNCRIDGGNLHLSYASGETATLTLADEALVRGEATLFPVEPLPVETKVDGSLSTVFYSGFATGSAIDAGRYQVKGGLVIRTPGDGSTLQTALIFKTGNDIMVGTLALASGAQK